MPKPYAQLRTVNCMQKKQEIQGLGQRRKVGIHTNRKENTKTDLHGRQHGRKGCGETETRTKVNGTNQTKGKSYTSWYRAGRSMRDLVQGGESIHKNNME